MTPISLAPVRASLPSPAGAPADAALGFSELLSAFEAIMPTAGPTPGPAPEVGGLASPSPVSAPAPAQSLPEVTVAVAALATPAVISGEQDAAPPAAPVPEAVSPETAITVAPPPFFPPLQAGQEAETGAYRADRPSQVAAEDDAAGWADAKPEMQGLAVLAAAPASMPPVQVAPLPSAQESAVIGAVSVRFGLPARPESGHSEADTERRGATEEAPVPLSGDMVEGFARLLDPARPAASPAHPAAPSVSQAASGEAAPAHALPDDSGFHQLDALVRDIAELSGSSARAAFRLTARELGQVEVRLHASEEGLTVAIRTESEHSHSAVASAQGQLSDDLRNNGLKVAATSVSLGQGGAERQRDERQAFSRQAFIEAAADAGPDLPKDNEHRPSGRFA